MTSRSRSAKGWVAGLCCAGLSMLGCGDSSSSKTAATGLSASATPKASATEIPTRTATPTASATVAATRAATPSATPTVTATPTAVDVAAKMGAATAAFWETLYLDAGRNDEVVDLVREVQSADPNNLLAFWYEAAMLTMKTAHEWDGKASTLQNVSPLVLERMARAESATDRAMELASEKGIEIPILPTWPGLTTFFHGFAKNDPEILALGVERLREGFATSPLLGSLMFAATAGQVLDRDDPVFAESVAVATQGVALGAATNCFETEPRICGDAGAAPHGAEGALLLYGDLFAKAGQPEQARFVYSLSRSLGERTHWRFLPVVDERLATLADRMALFADGDRDNDPPFGVPRQLCGMCHFGP